MSRLYLTRKFLYVNLLLLPFIHLTGQVLEVDGKIQADTIDIDGGQMINLAQPANETDAATKLYVDSLEDRVKVLEHKLITLEQCGATFISDIENNKYQIIAINDQCWMAENLKTTMYRDGTPIPLVMDSATWGNLSTPGYTWYNNDPAMYNQDFGVLYNFYVVADTNSHRVCPTGWHVPTDLDWNSLRDFLDPNATGVNGSENIAGGALKEQGTEFWNDPNTGATNRSGFNGRAGGFRNSNGSFASIGLLGYWWSTQLDNDFLKTSYDRVLHALDSKFYKFSDSQRLGINIRCIKD